MHVLLFYSWANNYIMMLCRKLWYIEWPLLQFADVHSQALIFPIPFYVIFMSIHAFHLINIFPRFTSLTYLLWEKVTRECKDKRKSMENVLYALCCSDVWSTVMRLLLHRVTFLAAICINVLIRQDVCYKRYRVVVWVPQMLNGLNGYWGSKLDWKKYSLLFKTVTKSKLKDLSNQKVAQQHSQWARTTSYTLQLHVLKCQHCHDLWLVSGHIHISMIHKLNSRQLCKITLF